MKDKTNVTNVDESTESVAGPDTVGALKLYREVIKDRYGKVLKDRNGNDLYNYYIPCKLNGRDVHIDFSAKDNGGYEVLSDIFAIAPVADLVIRDETSTDNNGQKRSYRVYEVMNTDVNGIVWSYQMKPSRKSDESQLSVFLQMIVKGITA